MLIHAKITFTIFKWCVEAHGNRNERHVEEAHGNRNESHMEEAHGNQNESHVEEAHGSKIGVA